MFLSCRNMNNILDTSPMICNGTYHHAVKVTAFSDDKWEYYMTGITHRDDPDTSDVPQREPGL